MEAVSMEVEASMGAAALTEVAEVPTVAVAAEEATTKA
jgi:hypothetical protein